jgi:hypothetical protein
VKYKDPPIIIRKAIDVDHPVDKV